MTYALLIEKRAQRALARVDHQHRERIIDAIRRLAGEQRPRAA